jgi:hypothetical protein
MKLPETYKYMSCSDLQAILCIRMWSKGLCGMKGDSEHSIIRSAVDWMALRRL